MKKTAQKKAHSGAFFFRRRCITCNPLPSAAASLLVRSVCGLPVSPPLALGRRRRRPKPGAEALVGLFAGDEHPPGTPTPSLPFPYAVRSSETLT